jgi:hypothetical protein
MSGEAAFACASLCTWNAGRLLGSVVRRQQARDAGNLSKCQWSALPCVRPNARAVQCLCS